MERRNGRKELIVKKHLSERSYELELPQGIPRRNRIQLRKTNESASAAAATQDEQCNEPRLQEPVSKACKLPCQTAAEDATQDATEVPPPATGVKAPELRRSQHVHQVPKHLGDYVLSCVPKL